MGQLSLLDHEAFEDIKETRKKKEKEEDFLSSINIQNPPRPDSQKYYVRYKDNTSEEMFTILDWEFTVDERDDSFGITEGKSLKDNFRHCFLPEKNAYWVSRDFKAQELRIVASLSQEPYWLEIFENGGDIHGEVAKLLWGEDNYNSELRSRAKAINFGLIYGKEAPSLSAELGISLKDAQQYIDDFFGKLPNIRKFLNRSRANAGRDLSLSNLYGRVRRFHKNKSNYNQSGLDNAGEREAYNFPIQSLGADITKIGLIKIFYNMLESDKYKGKVRFLSTIHDEINLSIDKSVLEDAIFDMGALMEHKLIDIRTNKELENATTIISEISIGNSMGLLFEFEQDLETKELKPVFKFLEKGKERLEKNLPF